MIYNARVNIFGLTDMAFAITSNFKINCVILKARS